MSETFEQFMPTLDHPWTPPAIQLIHQEILRNSPAAPDEIPELFEAYIFPDHCSYYGLAQQEELLALGSLRRYNSDSMTINDLAVRHDMQDRGYGKLVLTELEAIARRAGIMVMKVMPTRDPKSPRDARSFYAYHGYRPTPQTEWIKNLG